MRRCWGPLRGVVRDDVGARVAGPSPGQRRGVCFAAATEQDMACVWDNAVCQHVWGGGGVMYLSQACCSRGCTRGRNVKSRSPDPHRHELAKDQLLWMMPPKLVAMATLDQPCGPLGVMHRQTSQSGRGGHDCVVALPDVVGSASAVGQIPQGRPAIRAALCCAWSRTYSKGFTPSAASHRGACQGIWNRGGKDVSLL